ncbi:hypothetical protein ElyMa_004481000 [Elysia marginata]|uniref:Uncharacterized protein n=1 Tax=Elysia marginata TaxID=1093978 RepID=A0AAV4HKA1_9GAST|nr:hypothetical protein ElyMa_004481000 [Elysia marginata]
MSPLVSPHMTHTDQEMTAASASECEVRRVRGMPASLTRPLLAKQIPQPETRLDMSSVITHGRNLEQEGGGKEGE